LSGSDILGLFEIVSIDILKSLIVSFTRRHVAVLVPVDAARDDGLVADLNSLSVEGAAAFQLPVEDLPSAETIEERTLFETLTFKSFRDTYNVNSSGLSPNREKSFSEH